MTAHRSPWLAGFGHRADPALRVVALPYAGGRCTIYRDWPRLLSEDIEVVAVQYPGRGARSAERPLVDAKSAATQIAEALRPLLDRPYAIFGHCLGALIGFELARHLAGTGRPPLRLLVSARQAPDLPWPHQTVSDLPADELLAALTGMGGTPEDLLEVPGLLDRALPAFRADIRMEERYQYAPGPSLECPISVYGGRDDTVPAETLVGWDRQTVATTAVTWFPGGHFFLDTKRSALARQIESDLRADLTPAPTQGPEPEATRA